MARVVDVAAAWAGLAADVAKVALARIAWQAPLTAALFLVGALALHRAWLGLGGWAALGPALSGSPPRGGSCRGWRPRWTDWWRR
jgi:hypothetical protein